MALPHRVSVALLIVILLATVMEARDISVAAPKLAATPASGCVLAPTGGTAIASPIAAAVEPTLLASPERLVWTGGPHAVVLLHQSNLDMRSWTPQAEAIAGAGYTVVAIQNSGPNGLRIAIADLRDRCGATTVTVIGASVGGTVAQEALRSDPDAFDSLVVLSSSVDVGLLGTIPKLFVGTEGEITSINPTDQADASAGEDNTAVLYPGDAHAQEIFDTDNGPDLLNTILSWLADHP